MDSTERAFEAYGEPFKNMTAFNILGQVMTAGDDDWTAVVGNLCKARKIWGRLKQISSWEGADTKVLGQFLKAVTQAVLLFVVETLVLTPRMERTLVSFQNRVARRLNSRQLRRWWYGSWEYP